MDKLPNNPNCPLSGTRYCALLNMRTCSECTVGGNGDTPEQVMRDLDLYEQLLPEGGIAQLFVTLRCQFCKHEPVGQRNGYAILYMAHPEPKRIQRTLFKNSAAPFGTIIPVQISICKECRKKLLMLDYAPTLVAVLFGLIMVVLSLIRDTRTAMLEISTWFPFVLWAASIVIGIFLGKALSGALEKKFAGSMYVDILRHPVLREMTDKGWEPIRSGRSRVVFSKSRRVVGLGTAVPSDEDID